MTEVESTDYENNRKSSTLQYQRDKQKGSSSSTWHTCIPTQTLVTLVNTVEL